MRLTNFDTILICALMISGMITSVIVIRGDFVAALYFLIFPILIFWPAPSVFLYLVVFALFWFTIGLWRRPAGAICGVFAVCIVGIGLPILINRSIEAEDSAIQASDMVERQQIREGSSIGIVTIPQQGRPRGTSSDCGDICTFLLYSGAADRVIRGRQGSPVAWRLIKQNQPCEKRQTKKSASWFKLSKQEYDFREQLRERRLNGECLVRDNANLDSADIQITRSFIPAIVGNYYDPLDPLPEQTATRVEVLKKDAGGGSMTVSRRTSMFNRKLSLPLHFRLDISRKNTRIKWAREQTPRPEPSLSQIDQYLDIEPFAVQPISPEKVRALIDQWLSQPDLPPGVDGETLAEAFYDMVGRTGGQPQDVDRTIKILLDPRTKRPGQFGTIRWKFPDKEPELLDTILTRMEREPTHDGAIGAFDWALDRFSEDNFSAIEPRIAAMLRDPERRKAMGMSIYLLRNAGPEAVPLLMNILREETDPSSRSDSYYITERALASLCVIGSSNPPLYTEIEQMFSTDPVWARTLTSEQYTKRQRTYLVTLLRTGKSIDQMRKPHNARQTWKERYERLAADADCD